MLNQCVRKYFLMSLLFLSVFCINAYADLSLPSPTDSTQSLDNIVAYVNDDIITQHELDTGMARMRKLIEANQQRIPSDDQLQRIVLQQLIYQKIQLQMAKKAGIKATSEQVDQAIKRIAKQKHLTVAELKKGAAKEGITDFRKEIAKEMTITLLQQQAIGKTVVVSDSDLKKFYNQVKQHSQDSVKYHLVDLVVALPSSPSPIQLQSAKKKGQAILAKMKNSKDYNAIASHYADVSVNDLGWNSINSLPEIFVNQLPKMRINSVIGPLHAPNGLHIIKLLGKQGTPSPMPSQEKIQAVLYQQKFQKAVQKWLINLRKSSYIKINLPQ